MSSSPDLAHGSQNSQHSAILSRSLRRLQIHDHSSAPESDAPSVQAMDDSDVHVNGQSSARGDQSPDGIKHDPQSPSALPSTRAAQNHHVREGYGFRPASGISTPVISSVQVGGTPSPLPDLHGLGWPGEQMPFCTRSGQHLIVFPQYQSKVYRLPVIRNTGRESGTRKKDDCSRSNYLGMHWGRS